MVGDGQRIHWSEVFDGNPRMTKEITPDAVWVRSWPGFRPYLDRLKSTKEHQAYKPDFRVERGELYLTIDEVNHKQRDFVYIEPNVKTEVFGENKNWSFSRWQQVVERCHSVRFVQGRGRRLRGVEQVETGTFRSASGLLLHADLFVGTDGALHHAAAALGKPAIVVWGGVASPLNLGYDSHINLHDGNKPCGSFKPCQHCRKALDSITVDMVVNAIQSALRPSKTAGELQLPRVSGSGYDPWRKSCVV